jgi:hypothetical protein
MAMYLNTKGELLTDIGTGLIMNLNDGNIIISLTPAVTEYLLQETGDFLLQENGDKIIL